MSLFKKDKGQKPIQNIDDDLGDIGNIDFGSNADYKSTGDKSSSTTANIFTDKPVSAKRPNLSYGIEEAIALMRDLPHEPIELVVKVVKTTLESINVQVSDIIDDAKAKEKNIENRISQLSSEIKNYEEKIKNLKDSIELLEKDQAETKRVKEHLMLAKDSGSSKEQKTPNKDNLQNTDNKVSSQSQSQQNEKPSHQPPNIHKTG